MYAAACRGTFIVRGARFSGNSASVGSGGALTLASCHLVADGSTFSGGCALPSAGPAIARS